MAKSHHSQAMGRRLIQPCGPSRSSKTSSRPPRSTFQASASNAQVAANSTVPVEDVDMLSADDETEEPARIWKAPRESKPIAAEHETEEPVKICKAPREGKSIVPLAGDKFMHGLSVVLSLWVQEAGKRSTAEKPQQISRFHSSRAPSISIHDYLKRLRKYFLCSNECFVHALLYIDRIGKNNDSMTVSALTVHRLLMIAAMIAAKFHDDEFYANVYYGKAGGMTLKEVNMLEVIMLKELKWQMLVTVEEYELYHDLVCKAMACD